MWNLFGFDETIDLYSSDNLEFTKTLERLLEENTQYDICDVIYNCVLKKVKGSKEVSPYDVMSFYYTRGLPEEYLREISISMDQILLDYCSLELFDDASLMKNAIFLEAYIWIRAYHNDDVQIEIPTENNRISLERIENISIRKLIELLPNDTKKKMLNSKYHFESILGDYITVEHTEPIVKEEEIAEVEKEDFVQDQPLNVQMNFKYLFCEEVQMKILLDTNIKKFLDRYKPQGKIFTSVKEMYDNFYCADEMSITKIRDNSCVYVFVEWLTGFNTALVIYESVVKLMGNKADFEKNVYLNSVISKILNVRSPILRYWMIEIIGKSIKKARLCEVIQEDEEALSKMAAEIEKYSVEVQKLYESMFTLFVNGILWHIDNEIIEYDISDIAVNEMVNEALDYEDFAERRRERVLIDIEKQKKDGKKESIQCDPLLKIYEVLEQLDEKVENIARTEDFYLPSKTEQRINNSECLRKLSKAKEGSYEYKLFSFIMGKIVKENYPV